MPALSIAVLLRYEHQEFQQAQARAAREAAAQLGASVSISFAENSAFTQIQQVMALVRKPPEKRPQAIIVELVGRAEGYGSTARAALSAGIAWVEVSGLATSIAELRSEFSERIVMSVTTNEEDIGQIHAAQCRTLLPDGGRVLYIEGPSLQPEVKARRWGFEEGLRGRRIKIGKTLAGDWTEGSAARAMNSFLDRPHDFTPRLICAQNDEMALGASRVFTRRKSDLSHLPLLACDGLPDGGQRYVREGLLTSTVIKPVTTAVALKEVVQGLERQTSVQDVLLQPESFPSLDALSHFGSTHQRRSSSA